MHLIKKEKFKKLRRMGASQGSREAGVASALSLAGLLSVEPGLRGEGLLPPFRVRSLPEQGTWSPLQRLWRRWAVVAAPGSDCTGLQPQLFQSHEEHNTHL